MLSSSSGFSGSWYLQAFVHGCSKVFHGWLRRPFVFQDVWQQIMAKSRIAMRREVEAAEAAEAAAGASSPKKTRKSAGEKTESTGRKKASKGDKKEAAAKKKKAARPRTRRAREQMQRRRIVWVVYSNAMREEGRFLFYEKDKAEELLNTLMARGKRRYFMQPVKEQLNADGTPVVQVVVAPPEDDAEDEVRAVIEPEVAEDLDLDADLELDGEEGEEAAEVEGEVDEEVVPDL
jgi:hypothetical protein